MHHLAAVAVVLAVAASPASAFINHNLLVPRQTDSSGPSPTDQDPSSQCVADMISLRQLEPSPPPDLLSFARSYGDAYPTDDGCGWITALPSTLTAELASYETVISSMLIANAALFSAFQQDCPKEYNSWCNPFKAPAAGPAATPLPAATSDSTSASTTAPVTIGPTSPIITGTVSTVSTASSPVSTSTHTTSAAAPAAFAAGLGFLVSAVAAAGFLAALALL